MRRLKSSKQEAPWDRPDAQRRYTIIPWSVRIDKTLTILDRAVYETFSATAFVRKCNIVKLSDSAVARITGVSILSVLDSMPRLLSSGHVEALGERRKGRATAYRLTSDLFASPSVIVTNNEGAHIVARENIDAFRQRQRAKRKATA